MPDFTLAIASVITGLCVGVLSGMLGIGGGAVLVPCFRLLFQFDPVISTATSLFTIVPTSLTGAVTHVRNRTCVPKVGIAAGIGGAITSPVGVVLANISPGWLVMVIAACVIAYSAFSMLRKALRNNKKPAPASSGGDSPAVSKRQLIMGAAIGLVAGLGSGYIGVGGGFIMVPLFISVLGISMSLASGTSLIAVMILAIPGVIEQAFLGNVQFLVGIMVAVGSIPGAILGANLVRKVPERTLRLLFGIFLLCVAVLLAVNEFAGV